MTDQQWEQIAPFLPPEKTGKRGRPLKDNRFMLNAMIWIARSDPPWRDLPGYYAHGRAFTAVSGNGSTAAC